MKKAKQSSSRGPHTAQQPSPLTPPITSPNSRASVSSSGHHMTIGHDMGRLPSLGRIADSLTPQQSNNGQPNTGWGVSRYRSGDYEGEIYSHDMASQYFALAHIQDHQANGRGQPISGQRIMSRASSNYPLPCDDQEQQPQPWSDELLGRTLGQASAGHRHGNGKPSIDELLIRDFARLLAEISRVLKRGGTLIILDNVFPLDISLPSRDFVATVCPGLNAFQDAVKWSLTQSFSSSSGRGSTSSTSKGSPIMDAGQIADLVAYTAWMIDTKACEVKIPLGCRQSGRLTGGCTVDRMILKFLRFCARLPTPLSFFRSAPKNGFTDGNAQHDIPGDSAETNSDEPG
ncbi:hypothetical protein QFC22_002328 [Naganishia vaughanmartiniae]|uniref:Uncharacterized protein n=1 Tax=Naganishia vaughanmartiniae TaxID=1424756 RepID=A0ACC2XD14_9TREE|nr:hypothetical protein QFC22_002328 [Naganishia vaughanmartiniae]